MKSFFILIFFFFVSCGKCGSISSSDYEDPRCTKLQRAAYEKGQSEGVCYSGPLTVGLDEGAAHPDSEKCKALIREAGQKCVALPPAPNLPKACACCKLRDKL